VSNCGPKGFKKLKHKGYEFDDVDLLLIAMLRDHVLSVELCWSDPNNREYSGCYRVRDYQVKFNRNDDQYAGYACARSVGKTERQKGRGFSHFFRRISENLLITAPELLHLMPLVDAIEDRIEACRLLRECLKKDKSGATGFTHMPFGAEFWDGTKIIARIPQRDGRGVKGQHQPDLMIEEAQDYPDAGWVEIHETVMKDRPDFTYHFYGVHRGARGGGFSQRTQGGQFKVHTLTAIQRQGWGMDEKQSAIETYGGESSPDFRRNILGEPGAASSPIFVTARLMACIDQNRDSDYNTSVFRSIRLRWEDVARDGLPIEDLLDLPGVKYQYTVSGADLGLTNSPTVISVFAEMKYKAHGEKASRDRLALIRMFTLERFTTPQIRAAIRHLYNWNRKTQGIGLDITGLGFPIFQELQEDEKAPDQDMVQAVRGWKFNEKIPVGIDPSKITDGKDPFGNRVGEDNQVMMTVIEATTRYLREWVDTGYLLLPFDREIVNDLLAENVQRIRAASQVSGSRKPNAFHILDSFRMAALAAKLNEEVVQDRTSVPILDQWA